MTHDRFALRALAFSIAGSFLAQGALGQDRPAPASTEVMAESAHDSEDLTRAPQLKTYVTSTAAGMTVALDRQTGQMRALTADEALRLAAGIKALLNQSSEGLVEVHHADGSVSIDLEGRFQNVMVAKQEGDGTVSQACVDNPEAAAAFFEIDAKLVSEARKVLDRPSASELEIR